MLRIWSSVIFSIAFAVVLAGCGKNYDSTPAGFSIDAFTAPPGLVGREVAVRLWFPTGGKCVSDTPAGRYEVTTIPGHFVLPREALRFPFSCTAPDGSVTVATKHTDNRFIDTETRFIYLGELSIFMARASLLQLGSAASEKSLTNYGNELAASTNPDNSTLVPEMGFTMASSSSQHGIQIAYWGVDGDYALWYPGNKRPLLGTWRKTERPMEYCFSYRVNTQNPVLGTRSRAGNEQCGFIADGDWVAKASGDVFNLSSGKLPGFDLSRCILPRPLELSNDGPCKPKR